MEAIVPSGLQALLASLKGGGLKYLPCKKGGFHEGQVLNLVCMEPECDKSLLCPACLSESHGRHRIKSLKQVLVQSLESFNKAYEQRLQPQLLEAQIRASKAELKLQIQAFLQSSMIAVEQIEKLGATFFLKVGQLIRYKARRQVFLQESLSSVLGAKDRHSMDAALSSILAVGCESSRSSISLTEEEVVENIKRIIEANLKQTKKEFSEVSKQLSSLCERLQSATIQSNVFRKVSGFQFSKTLHHASIVIQSETKAHCFSGYINTLALLEPSVEHSLETRKVGFKIVQLHNYWAAIGVCHKQFVESKGFVYSLQENGQGAYLVNANGNTYSHIDPEINNKPKCFTFSAGETVILEINQVDRKLTFSKLGSKTSFVMKFEPRKQDPLHFCVLFYSSDDVVEFVQDFKQ